MADTEQEKRMDDEQKEQKQQATDQTDTTASDSRNMSVHTGDVDERGVPWRNVAAEYRRKYEKLQKQVEELRRAESEPKGSVSVPESPGTTDDIEAELLRAGYDPNAVKLLSKLIARRIDAVMNTVAPVVEDTYSTKMDQQITKLKADPSIGSLIQAYEKDIRDYLSEVKQPALRADERTIRAALGLAISADPSRLESLQKRAAPVAPFAEPNPPSGGAPAVLVDQNDLVEFMQDTGIDEDRARSILAKRKKVLSGAK